MALRHISMYRRLSRYVSWAKLMIRNCMQHAQFSDVLAPLVSLGTFAELALRNIIHQLGKPQPPLLYDPNPFVCERLQSTSTEIKPHTMNCAIIDCIYFIK